MRNNSFFDDIFRICHLIWRSEFVRTEMLVGIFIMLYKKNSRNDFGNYRAICLICHGNCPPFTRTTSGNIS